MARLRARTPKNNRWVDICQSEWYRRDDEDEVWIRFTPAPGMKVRHGTNNYWLDIDCMSEADCGPDQYGGTEDGLGENGTGPGLPPTDGNGNPVTDVGYPGDTDGSLVPGPFDPWNPGTYIPSRPSPVPPGNGGGWTPGGDWSWNVGGNGPGNPWYTDPNGNESPGGSGDDTNGPGYQDGVYIPGFDLPDAAGPGAGLDDNGNIVRPGSGNEDSYDDGGNGTGPEEGTADDPHACPVTIHSKAKQITEFYVDVGTEDGQVDFEYNIFAATAHIVAYYAGQRIFSSNTYRSGTGRLSFDYQYNGSDSKIFVRVRSTGGAIPNWMVQMPCPVPDGEKPPTHGTIDDPAPCVGSFEPLAGGGTVTETIHDIGAVGGRVVIDYEMYNVPDRIEVFYNGVVIADTLDFVRGKGELPFQYAPQHGNTLITIRMSSPSPGTAWKYNIICPDGDGNENNPKTCSDQNVTQSGGAGTTELFFEMGDTNGQVALRYQAWYVPDTFTVYQNDTLLATTGEVTGDGYLRFNFNHNNGTKLKVVIQGEGKTTWAFLLACPEIPVNIVSCGNSAIEGDQQRYAVGITGAANGFAYIRYATTNGSDTRPNDIHVFYNDVEVETRTNINRSNGADIGGLVIPTVANVNSYSLDTNEDPSWWAFTPHCVVQHASTLGMSKFMTGFPHVEAGTIATNISSFSRRISTAGGGSQVNWGKAKSCQVLMSMIHLPTGNVHLRAMADDFASVYLVAHGANTPLLLAEITSYSAPQNFTANVAPGTYFVYVFLEEFTDMETECWFAGVFRDGGANGNVMLNSNTDWYGQYFEKTRSYPQANLPLIEDIEAAIFDTEAEAQAYMTSNPPVSIENIFNQWPRFDGQNTYANRAAAESQAPSSAAAAWSFKTNPDRFEQLQNTATGNGIFTPAAYSDYVLEATIRSDDSGDDDGNGIILATHIVEGVRRTLVVMRTRGGLVPRTGIGLLIDGAAGWSTFYEEEWGTANESGGWAGRYTRVRAVRTGNQITVQWSEFNSTVLTNSRVIDLTRAVLSEFQGPKPVGFYTKSQARSSFYDVQVPGLAVQSAFSIQNHRIWTVTGSGWTLKTDAMHSNGHSYFASVLGPYKLARNPGTNKRYHVYRWAQRAV